MKYFAISDLTGKIYYGTGKDVGGGRIRFTGNKEDVTDEAVKAVFEWFLNKALKSKKEIIVRFPNVDFELAMREKTEDKKGPLEIKAESKFNEECAADCPCHKTVTHNACLFCNACRKSPYLKDELAGKSDEEIEKIQKEVEAEA